MKYPHRRTHFRFLPALCICLGTWVASLPAEQYAGLDAFFNGTFLGDAGEAAVSRNQGPLYYHFTLEGLSGFEALDTLRIETIPHESHASRSLVMTVFTSQPFEGEDALPGYDFSLREETGLTFTYLNEENEVIAADVQERDLNQTGRVEVRLSDLAMDDVRTFRLAFEPGFRGAVTLPSVEVTGVPKGGGEPVTLARYDFEREGRRAFPSETHPNIRAGLFTPQGYPLPVPIVSTETPAGSYAAVELHFLIPDAPESFQDWRVYGGLRDNRMPVDHWIRVTAPGGELIRDGQRFSGRFERQHRGEIPREVHVNSTLDDAGRISGSVTVHDNCPWAGTGATWTGTVSGFITPEAELRAVNEINPDASWPRFTGPDMAGNAAKVLGHDTINALDEIRHQWAGEATDIGQGIGSLNRFAFNFTAARKRSGGGSSSPVVDGGKVYLYYSVPSPRTYNYFHRAQDFTSGHTSFESAAVSMARQGAGREVFEGGPEDLPVGNLEKIWEAADDVVICMDAATGQTLWRTRMEGVGYNRQHHKEGPYNQTVAVNHGRIFAIGSGGWLHALDRHTGEALWHKRVGGEHSHQKHAVLAIDEAVVIPDRERWAAFDPATGERLWRNERLPVANVSIPAFWRAEDGTPVLFVYSNGDGTGLTALHARSGETLFAFELPKAEGADSPGFARGSGRAGNPNNITIFGNALVTHEHLEGDRFAVGVYDISLEDIVPRWRVPGIVPRWRVPTEHIRGEWSPVVVAGRWVVTSPTPNGILVFDLETGELKSEGEGDHPGSNGLLMAMEDLVISQDDMTHGQIRITFYKIDGNGQIRNLNPDGYWPLVTPGTGSYHHPVMQAVADGRIFLRQRGGIHAYDLRSAR